MRCEIYVSTLHHCDLWDLKCTFALEVSYYRWDCIWYSPQTWSSLSNSSSVYNILQMYYYWLTSGCFVISASVLTSILQFLDWQIISCLEIIKKNQTTLPVCFQFRHCFWKVQTLTSELSFWIISFEVMQ